MEDKKPRKAENLIYENFHTDKEGQDYVHIDYAYQAIDLAKEEAEARIQELQEKNKSLTILVQSSIESHKDLFKQIEELEEEIKRKDQLIKRAFFYQNYTHDIHAEFDEWAKINNIEL